MVAVPESLPLPERYPFLHPRLPAERPALATIADAASLRWAEGVWAARARGEDPGF